jgi:hypothetical protein
MAARGLPLGSALATLLRLLDTYGAKELAAALDEVLAGGALHPQAVRCVLERRREDAGRPPATEIPLPDDPRVKDLSVRPHELGPYDALKGEDDHDDDEEDPREQGERPGA